MKTKIIEILKSKSFNVTDQAGNELIIVEKSDFDEIADTLIELYNEPIAKTCLNCKFSYISSKETPCNTCVGKSNHQF